MTHVTGARRFLERYAHRWSLWPPRFASARKSHWAQRCRKGRLASLMTGRALQEEW
jgi:hypothetical protein